MNLLTANKPRGEWQEQGQTIKDKDTALKYGP